MVKMLTVSFDLCGNAISSIISAFSAFLFLISPIETEIKRGVCLLLYVYMNRLWILYTYRNREIIKKNSFNIQERRKL